MGNVIAFQKTTDAALAIQACRRELAAFLLLNSTITQSVCLSRIRRILHNVNSNFGPPDAQMVILLAKDIEHRHLPDDDEIEAFVEVFDSPAAKQFATADVPNLVGGD